MFKGRYGMTCACLQYTKIYIFYTHTEISNRMYRKLRNSVDVTVCYDILSFVCTPWRWYFCAETCTSEVTNILQVHLVGTLHEDIVLLML